MIQLRTVDVWDTLLRRKCHPDAVKLHIANYFLFRYWSEIRPAVRDPRILLALRLDVERDLARISAENPARGDEYGLRDVLDTWTAHSMEKSRQDSCLILDELESEEFLQEQSVSYRDHGMDEILEKTCAKRTLFLSDFYMPAERLATLLKSKGVIQFDNGGHSSCDYGLNKRSGRLYLELHKLYSICPQEHVHIGDNAWSDVKVPRRLGISVLHYQHPAEDRKRRRRCASLYDRASLYRRVQRKCRETTPSIANRRISKCFNYGVELAPLFAAYALFILESVRRDQVNRLFFFSREGEFFSKIYSLLRDGAGRLNLVTPMPRTLEVSRIATFAASLQDVSVDEMQRLWRTYNPQSMKTWAQSLDVDSVIAASWCRRYRIEWQTPLLNPWNDERVCKLLQDADCRYVLGQLIRERRSLLLEYLRGQGVVTSGERVGVVDIGWRGTIQDNIATLMPEGHFFGYYLGLQKFLNPQPSNTRKTAFGPNLNFSQEHQRLFRNLPLIEMLTNSSQGSVTGYEYHSDGIVYSKRLIDANENVVHSETVAHIQAGILHGVWIWAEQIHIHALSSGEMRKPGLAIWSGIVNRTPGFVLDALAQLKHNELFGRGVFEQPKTTHQPWMQSLFRSVK